eukprot:scaffold8528_cov85-Skeletonema_dohrnii-CCMP3373.AAC.2
MDLEYASNEDLFFYLQHAKFIDHFLVKGSYRRLHNMSNEDWERLGRAMAANVKLEFLALNELVLDRPDQIVSSFFRGLTGSNTVSVLELNNNGFGVDGARSMVPFLRNANELQRFDIDDNDITSEGFQALWSALSESPITALSCSTCLLDTIEINIESIPNRLSSLALGDNSINSDGCRELSKLFLRENATLKSLFLDGNDIDDDGAEILADALQNNTSLECLHLGRNHKMTSKVGGIMLKLVNDISSIKATMQSNHTLETIVLPELDDIYCTSTIYDALRINKMCFPTRAAKLKVIQTQLNSNRRAAMCHLQGIEQSNATLYRQIDPLVLPEVLSLVGQTHGQGELYVTLVSSVDTLFATVNREECLKQKREERIEYLKQQLNHHAAEAAHLAAEAAYHTAKSKEFQDELSAMEEENNGTQGETYNDRCIKRRRK